MAPQKWAGKTHAQERTFFVLDGKQRENVCFPFLAMVDPNRSP